MTLVMALLMMVVLTSVSTTTIYFVTSNVHSTGISKASTSAYDVAEAGLNDSVAKMYNQLDTDGSILASGIDPRSSTMFPSCGGGAPPAPPPHVRRRAAGAHLDLVHERRWDRVDLRGLQRNENRNDDYGRRGHDPACGL
jgi:hypothetical protein